MADETVVFRAPLYRRLGLLLISAMFVFAGWAMTQDTKTGWPVAAVGYCSMLLFGLGIVLLLAETVHPRIALRMDQEGISILAWTKKSSLFLPWTEFAGARTTMVGLTSMVVFDTVDPEWGLRFESAALRRAMKMNKSLVGAWIAVAPRNYGLTNKKLLAELEKRRPPVSAPPPLLADAFRLPPTYARNAVPEQTSEKV